MEIKKLVNLDPKLYEHPFDKKALEKFKILPGADTVTNFMLNWTYVKWHMVALRGGYFKVTRESCPELYDLARDVAETLDVKAFPDIYTQWGYDVNAYTTGTNDDTLLVLNSGSIDLLNESQLRYIIGHEMGHIKSNHVLYHTMAKFFSCLVGNLPLGEKIFTPLQLALLYWERMSEFTADRAGLLACQNEEEVVKAICKVAGVPLKYFDKIDTESFIHQAEDFENMTEFAQKAIRTVTIATSDHPWSVLRASELLKWIKSGEYDKVISATAACKCCHCGAAVSPKADICPKCGLNPFDGN